MVNVGEFTGVVSGANGFDVLMVESAAELDGVDDLAKYRIVIHLLRNPDLRAGADVFAAALGFHSAERTAVLLDEMVGDGLLSKHVMPGASCQYGLCPDSTLRLRLNETCSAEPGSEEFEIVLRRLAHLSVMRAKRDLKANSLPYS